MSVRLDPAKPGPACGKCGELKHYTGTRWRCSSCFNKWQSAWKAKRTPEQKRAAQAKQTATRRKWSPEQREKAYDRVRAWREANPDKRREGNAAWYQRTAETRRAAKLAEYQNNPAAFIARNFVRKSRLLKAICEHGADCVDSVFLADLYSKPCLHCGALTEHADHFFPLARGGLHCRDNLVPACDPCNRSKHARDPLEWLVGRRGDQ